MNVNTADFFAFAVQVVNCLVYNVGQGTHRYDNAFSVFCTVIIKRFVCTARNFGNLSHIISYDIRHCVIELVVCFTMLEVNIRVFGSTANFRIIRIECTLTETFQSILINEITEFVEFHNFNFLNFVRRAETVKEVDKRQGSLQSCQVSYTGKVHNFLNIGFRQKTATCRTSGHNVLMVTENAECVISQGTSSNMEYAR